MKIIDLTTEDRADLTDRLRNRPGSITAAEKLMLAGVLDRLRTARHPIHGSVVAVVDFIEGAEDA